MPPLPVSAGLPLLPALLLTGAAMALAMGLALVVGNVRLLLRVAPIRPLDRTEGGRQETGPLERRPPGRVEAGLRRLLLSADPATAVALAGDLPLLPGRGLLPVAAAVLAGTVLLLCLAALPLAVALLLAPLLVVGGMRGASAWCAARWRARFRLQIAEAIALLIRGIRAGAPVAEAVAHAGRDLPAPIGPALAGAHDSVRLGRPIEDALWDVARRVRSPEMDFLCVAVSVQRETGGNLAETLAELENMVRKRQALVRKVRALSAEARASALIIGALPVLVGAALFLVAPDYMAPMTGTRAGRLLLSVAAASLLLGATIMAQMIGREA